MIFGKMSIRVVTIEYEYYLLLAVWFRTRIRIFVIRISLGSHTFEVPQKRHFIAFPNSNDYLESIGMAASEICK
jgi:hypothetical protein